MTRSDYHLSGLTVLIFVFLFAATRTLPAQSPWSKELPGIGTFSSPRVADLDNDGNLDIVLCHGTNTKQTYTFDGMRVERLTTTIPIKKKIAWGAYMGSNYDGIFRR